MNAQIIAPAFSNIIEPPVAVKVAEKAFVPMFSNIIQAPIAVPQREAEEMPVLFMAA